MQSAASAPSRHPLRLSALLTCVTLLGACRPAHTEAPAAQESPAAQQSDREATAATAAAPSDAPKANGRLSPAHAQAEAKRILAEIAQTRGLALKSGVRVDVIDKAGIRKFAQDSMYEHTTKDELALMGQIEVALGVMPAGSDPEKVMLDLLEQGVLGLYDPKGKVLLIGDFVDASMLTMVVGHEIAHGLQDMYFDLEQLQMPLRHQSDAESARRFLVEGEAQAAYLAWRAGADGVKAFSEPVLQAMGDQALDLAATASPYPILARDLQMPYTDGTATVLRLVQQQGWEAITALYQQMPTTTEQMLHLDKLLAREPAVSVRIDPKALVNLVAPAGLSEVWHDNLGEAALLAMLADVGKSQVARKAATGWGGDQFVAFAREAHADMMVAGITVWDSTKDAEEFAALFAQYLAKQAPTGHALQQRGKRVGFAVGIPEGIPSDRVLAALWKGAQVGG